MKSGKSNFSASKLLVSGQDGRFSRTSVFPNNRLFIENEPTLKPVKFLLKSVLITMVVGVGFSGSSKDRGNWVPPLMVCDGESHIGFSFKR